MMNNTYLQAILCTCTYTNVEETFDLSRRHNTFPAWSKLGLHCLNCVTSAIVLFIVFTPLYLV